MRLDDRGDRARLPRHAVHAGAAHRARQGKDPRGAHSLSGALASRAAGVIGLAYHATEFKAQRPFEYGLSGFASSGFSREGSIEN